MASTAARLLDSWEQIYPHSAAPVGRTAALARTFVLLDKVATLDLDRVSRLLLDSYEASCGARFEAVADCPECGQMSQLEFTTRDVRASFAAPLECNEQNTLVEAEGISVRIRPLTLDDLLAVEHAPHLDAARQLLLQMAVVSVDGEAITPGSLAALSEPMAQKISAALEKLQPAADVRVSLNCQGCGHEWSPGFDVSGHFWIELDSAAAALQRQIALLAAHYGWSEGDILAMSARRRQIYAELIDARVQ